MRARGRDAAALAMGLLLSAAGCASTAPESTTPQAATNGAYQLTPDEKQLDCKKLTGRMQVRILQERDYVERRPTSAVAQTMQQTSASVFGGASRGASPADDHARARAELEAYNAQLAAKGCRTFDLATELQPKPITVTPTPVQKPETAAKPKR